jgi:hypothetical protein
MFSISQRSGSSASNRSHVVRMCAAAALALVAGSASAQTIVRGPIQRPSDPSRYYVIQGANWTQLRDFARSMGGDLATINDAAENTFINSTVLVANDKAFIGLNDAATEGTLVWSDGSTATYRNWSGGSAENDASSDFALIRQADAQWSLDVGDFTNIAIVEIRGPVRLPGEVSTFANAVSLANQGPREVLLGPGTWGVPNANFEIDQSITLTGSGVGVTTFQSWVGASTFIVEAPMTMRNLSINYRTLSPMFVPTSSTAAMTFTDCDITSVVGQDSGQVVNGAATTVTVERCNVFNVESFIRTASGTSNVTFINSVIRDLGAVAISPTSGTNVVTFVNSVITRMAGVINMDTASTKFVNSIVLDEPNVFTPGQLQNSVFTTVNPGFVNPAGNNFQLLPTSPLIDAGSTAGFLAAGASDFTDLAGNVRGSDVANIANTGSGALALDIGAYEFQGQIGCSSIDFNNNGVFPEDQDVIDFFTVLSGGPCSQ